MYKTKPDTQPAMYAPITHSAIEVKLIVAIILRLLL
jgi:hypothetical protein